MEAQKPNNTQKANKAVSSNVRGIKNAFLVICACAVVAVCLFIFVLGADSNFENGHPINLLGTIYKGGFIVPILQTLFLTVIVLSVERWIALSSAKGSGSIPKFVANVKAALVKKGVDAGRLETTINDGNLTNFGAKCASLDRAVTVQEKK